MDEPRTPKPDPKRVAVIDIGTNSTRLLVADVAQQAIDEVSQVLAYANHGTLASTLGHTVEQVLAATATNTSSMRADLIAHRRTEVDDILGFLLNSLAPDFSDNNQPRPATPLLETWLNELRQRSACHE